MMWYWKCTTSEIMKSFHASTIVFNVIIFFTHLLYIICRVYYKCVCSISTGLWMSYAKWHNSYTRFSFVHLGIILMLVLRCYSGLSGRVRTVHLFSLCVVSLLSSWFTASALVWFSNLNLNLHSGGGVQTGSTRHVGHLLAYRTCPTWLWEWRIWWNEWQGKPKYSEKTCPSATLSTTNPTWPDPGMNPGRQGGKPVTNRFSYGRPTVF
jgi:hypothetical protein